MGATRTRSVWARHASVSPLHYPFQSSPNQTSCKSRCTNNYLTITASPRGCRCDVIGPLWRHHNWPLTLVSYFISAERCRQHLLFSGSLSSFLCGFLSQVSMDDVLDGKNCLGRWSGLMLNIWNRTRCFANFTDLWRHGIVISSLGIELLHCFKWCLLSKAFLYVFGFVSSFSVYCHLRRFL